MYPKDCDTTGHMVIPETYVLTPAFERWFEAAEGGRYLTYRSSGQRFRLVAHVAGLFVYECLDKPAIPGVYTGPRVSPLRDR